MRIRHVTTTTEHTYPMALPRANTNRREQLYIFVSKCTSQPPCVPLFEYNIIVYYVYTHIFVCTQVTLDGDSDNKNSNNHSICQPVRGGEDDKYEGLGGVVL